VSRTTYIPHYGAAWGQLIPQFRGHMIPHFQGQVIPQFQGHMIPHPGLASIHPEP